MAHNRDDLEKQQPSESIEKVTRPRSKKSGKDGKGEQTGASASKRGKHMEEKSKAADKHKKPKLVRDSFTLPHADYALFKALKGRCIEHGVEVKKSELVRVALRTLAEMNDNTLLRAVNRLERLKSGRPPQEAAAE
jgi:hypothetical protein